MIDPIFAQNSNAMVGVVLVTMWVMWMFLVGPDVQGWIRKQQALVSGAEFCPICRKQHRPEEGEHNKGD